MSNIKTKKMKPYLIILLLTSNFFYFSCSNPAESVYDFTKARTLSVADTLFRFDTEMAAGVSASNNTAFVLLVDADTAIVALNMDTKKIVSRLGRVGNGPNEVLGPAFITAVQDFGHILLSDINSKQILEIKQNGNNFQLNHFIPYPNELFPASNLSISKHLIVGRGVSYASNKMFFIYNYHTKSKIEIDVHPVFEDIKDANYYCAANTALNEDKKRIIAGMFFLDMFHVYDTNGAIVKTVYLSKDYTPEIDKKNKSFLIEKGTKGITRLFPTKNFCYMLRKVELPDVHAAGSMNKTYFLLKADWDGNIKDSFRITDEIIGDFFVDEAKNQLLAITHSTQSLDKEFYDVVRYDLDNHSK